MGLHSFFEGIAFGVTDSDSESINIFIAIMAHKWSDAMVVGISFIKTGFKFNVSLRYMIFYSFITPLGVILGYSISKIHNPKVSAIMKAISGGTFLYIACIEIITKEFLFSNDKYWKYLCYILGIVFILLVGLIE